MSIHIRSYVLVIASALLVAGCGGTDEAKRGVAEFRSLVAQRSYAEIYFGAGPELRQVATQEQFERLMATIDTRLGSWQSAEEPAWNVTRGTGGHFVRLTYQSQFARGAGASSSCGASSGAARCCSAITSIHPCCSRNDRTLRRRGVNVGSAAGSGPWTRRAGVLNDIRRDPRRWTMFPNLAPRPRHLLLVSTIVVITSERAVDASVVLPFIPLADVFGFIGVWHLLFGARGIFRWSSSHEDRVG